MRKGSRSCGHPERSRCRQLSHGLQRIVACWYTRFGSGTIDQPPAGCVTVSFAQSKLCQGTDACIPMAPDMLHHHVPKELAAQPQLIRLKRTSQLRPGGGPPMLLQVPSQNTHQYGTSQHPSRRAGCPGAAAFGTALPAGRPGIIISNTTTTISSSTTTTSISERPVMTSLHAKLRHALRSNGLLDTDSVLVAVSGGKDSVCLLQLLFDLQSSWQWRLGVVHCDHGWRQDSAANAAFVRELAEARMGLPYYERVAPAGTPQTERAARDWRYAVFAEVAAAHGYGTVVTAHTATDRAETMLLNLFRGAGPDGLATMPQSRPLFSLEPTVAAAAGAIDPDLDRQLINSNTSNDAGASSSGMHANAGPSTSISDDCSEATDAGPPRGVSDSCGSEAGGGSLYQSLAVRLVRPLLGFTRDDTHDFIEQLSLPYYHDSTNDCNDLRRNRLRNEVLPLLRRHFNLQLDRALFRTMEVLEADVELLANLADNVYDGVVVTEPYGGERAAAEDEQVHSTGRGRGSRGKGNTAANGDGASKRTGGSRDGDSGCRRPGGILAESAGDNDVRYWCSKAIKLPELRQLPLALQRRVVRRWLRTAVAERNSKNVRSPSFGSGGGGEREGEGADAVRRHGARRSSEVGYEDVARCLALLNAPNRTNSDSLCGDLVAQVLHGRLYVRWLRGQTPAATAAPRPHVGNQQLAEARAYGTSS